MKKIIFITSLLLITVSSKVYCQCWFGDASSCTNVSGGVCPDMSCTGWNSSHGDPNIDVGHVDLSCAHNPFNYFYTWYRSDISKGEGIYHAYTFTGCQSYKVTVVADVAGGTGQIFVYAARGITTQVNDCGGTIQAVSDKELIGIISPATNGGCQPFPICYTPTSGYTQIWLYPSSTSMPQYSALIKSVEVCVDNTCTGGGDLIFNTGVIPATTHTAMNVQAGSSAGTGGAGTVTVSSTGTTILQGVQTVYLKGEFQASVTSGTFIARNVPCSTVLHRPAVNQPNSAVIDNPPADSIAAYYAKKLPKLSLIDDEVRIYPSPGKGVINVELNGSYTTSSANISILNASGVQVMAFHNQQVKNRMRMDLGTLSNGLYFVKLVLKEKTITKKIIIQR